jgi:creatinine amidohydrolase
MAILAWTDLKTTDFAALPPDRAVAVLPIAAVEQHGPHLPTGTDALILDAILEALRQRELANGTALLLPLQAVGASPEHANFAGTLSAGAETLLALWTDIGRAVARTGIRRLLVLNSHGGNTALADVAASRLRIEAGLAVATCTTHRLGAPAGLVPPEEARFGIHGGRIETALVRAIAPHLVADAACRDFASSETDLVARHPDLGAAGGLARLAWMAEDLNPEGVVGNAALATAAEGRAILHHMVEHLARLLDDLLTLTPPAVSR